jgi:hypothetical protein
MSQKPEIYRHVVLFKFFDKTPEETIRSIESAFRDLCKQLPFVTGFEWGLNSSPENLNEGFTHCFIVSFASPAGRDQYLPHTLHQQFCRTYLDPNLEKVCVIDFNVNN